MIQRILPQPDSHGVDLSPQKIVAEYFEILKKRMSVPARSLRIADEEDVAIEAIEDFLRLSEQGAFGQIENQKSLTSLIFLIARRKLADMLKYEMAMKRGGKEKIVCLDQQMGSYRERSQDIKRV